MGIQINGTTDTISAVDGSLDINQNATFGNNVTIGGTLTYSDVTNIDSVGLVTAKNGLRIHAGGIDLTSGISTFSDNIQIADKIIHKDDTNTALRFPTADTFAVETAGSERLRITSAGRVGINTTNPGTNLTVWANDSVTDTDVFQVRSKTGAFNIQVSDSDASNPEWAIRTYSNEPIVFKQATVERMRIKSDGNVGIGTDNPTVRLTVSSDSPAVMDVHHVDGGTNDEARIILGALALNPPSNRGAGIAAVNNGAGHDLIIKCSASHAAGPTEKLRITSAGKVGINEDVPQSTLHVASTSNYVDIGLSNSTSGHTGSDGANIFYNNNLELALWNRESTGIIRFATAGTERARITSSGTVSIGGTLAINKSSGDYGSPLHIIADANENAITVEGLKAAINWRYTDGSANRRGGIKWNGSSGQVLFDSGVSGNGYYYQFNLNGSERFKITSGGNALFGGSGVSQTNRQLVVGSNAEANLAIETHNTSASETANIRFYRSRGTAASPTTLVDDDVISQLMFYGHDGTDYAHAAALIKVECDGTVAGNQMPGALSFHTNSGTTTATERLRIRPSGQVDFASRNFTMGTQADDGATVGITGNAWSNNEIGIKMSHKVTGGQSYFVFYNPNGQVGYIQSSGSGTIYNTGSDHRLKENQVLISDGITRLKQLKPYRFNFKKDPSTTLDGFFAHEVQSVVPEAIAGTKDEVATKDEGDRKTGDPIYQGMDYGRITPLLTAALQEAIAEIETLKTKVAALESS